MIPTKPEPSDATRFATRPKQRKAETTNATDNEMGKLRREARAVALVALAAPTKAQLKSGEWLLMLATPGNPAKAHRVLEEGMWKQWVVEDDRTLDPETVAEAFARAEREYSAAIHNRAVIRQYGVAP
jgi:hypothetical protein